MRLSSFRVTRFQFARDRVIGDSQVQADDVNCAALELITDDGKVGLGFLQTLFQPLPDQVEIERIFANEVWPGIEGKHPASLVHQVTRPRGGNRRAFTLPFHEALQVALWDLAAKAVDLPLYKLLGANRNRVRAYASGLDFHLSDEEFVDFFAHADAIGYSAFKIKVGHPDFEWDLNRLNLVHKTVRKGASFMIDTNEGWGAKEALNKLQAIQRAGFNLLWSEDPILRDDLPGLKMLCDEVSWTMINSGEWYAGWRAAARLLDDADPGQVPCGAGRSLFVDLLCGDLLKEMSWVLGSSAGRPARSERPPRRVRVDG